MCIKIIDFKFCLKFYVCNILFELFAVAANAARTANVARHARAALALLEDPVPNVSIRF